MGKKSKDAAADARMQSPFDLDPGLDAKTAPQPETVGSAKRNASDLKSQAKKLDSKIHPTSINEGNSSEGPEAVSEGRKKKRSKGGHPISTYQGVSRVEPAILGQVSPPLPGDPSATLGKEGLASNKSNPEVESREEEAGGQNSKKKGRKVRVENVDSGITMGADGTPSGDGKPGTEGSRKRKIRASDLKSPEKKPVSEIQPCSNNEGNSSEDPEPMSEGRKKKRSKGTRSSSIDQGVSPAEPAVLGQVTPPLLADVPAALGKEGHGRPKDKGKQDEINKCNQWPESGEEEDAGNDLKKKGRKSQPNNGCDSGITLASDKSPAGDANPKTDGLRKRKESRKKKLSSVVQSSSSNEGNSSEQPDPALSEHWEKRGNKVSPSSSKDQGGSHAEEAVQKDSKKGRKSRREKGGCPDAGMTASDGIQAGIKAEVAEEHAEPAIEATKEQVQDAAEVTGELEEQVDDATQGTEEQGGEDQPPVVVGSEALANKTLCVGNLPYNILPEELKVFFTQAGFTVTDYLLPCHGGVIRGFGYVEFQSLEEAKEALNSLDNLELMGHRISLKAAFQSISEKRGLYPQENWGIRQSIVVTGLDTSLKEHEVKESLEEHFSQCKIKHIRVLGHRDNVTGVYSNAGKAIIDFVDNASFSVAKEHDSVLLSGNILSMKEARYKVDPQGFICVPCGGTGIICGTCGAIVGGKASVAQSVWVGTGSGQGGSANLPGPAIPVPPNLRGRGGRGCWKGRGKWGGPGGLGRWRGRARRVH